MSKRAINPNLKFLAKHYKTAKGIRLAGSSRSAKTWSIIHWLIWLSSVKDERATVHILRSTYNSFKTTLYEDFKRIFNMFGIQNNPFNNVQEIANFDLFGLKIHFIGADKVGKSKGAGADYVWFNEVTEIPKEIFDQKEMRCRKMWVADYNPSEFDHWIYPEQMRRDDVPTLKTTFLDNHFISETEKNKILSYEPTEENIKNGTADKYMWSVYGMGESALREGAIITNWEEGAFDESLPYVWGMDFGYAQDPTTLVKVAVKDNLIYAKEYLYAAGLSTQQIADVLNQHIKKDDLIIADSSEPRLIDELFYMDFNIHKAKKGADSVRYGLQKIREKKLIIDGDNLVAEVRKYVWIDGKSNTPIDKYNHCFVGETLITTINGEIPIKEVKEGDLVLTSNGYRSVLKKFNNGVKKVYSFGIVFGTFSLNLQCTSDHLIKTQRGWIQIKELKPLDYVYLNKSLTEKHTTYTKTKGISVRERKDYIGLFGSLTKGIFQRVTTYTTLIVTHITTTYQTFHLLALHYTKGTRQKREWSKIPSMQNSFIKKVLKQQSYGISLRKVLNGIKNTQKIMVSGILSMIKNVKTVYLTLLQKQNGVSFAAINVNQQKEGRLELTTKQGFVQSAQKNIKHQNTGLQKVVHVHVQTLSEQEVYDLMVDKDHEYFADGVLVHNCIDSLRYSLEELIANY